MFDKKTIQDVDVKDAVVLVRTDYNVPMQDGEINSDLRIKASLPTIKYLLEHKASKIILLSHLGRPQGREEALSLKKVAETLAGLLPGTVVNFVDEVSGAEVEHAVEELPEGGILLLENLRFFAGEQANSLDFAKEIIDATHANLFVQDGFAVTHRANASTDAITQLLPSVAGLLVAKEVTELQKVISDPKKPLVVVIGGAKVKDKQPMIDAFLNKADKIIVGGKIVADGYQSDNPKIYVAEDFDEDEHGDKLDVGPVAMSKIAETCLNAGTVLWAGVLGKVEDATYATSSIILAKLLGEHPEITSVICGGDTSGFVENLCLEDQNLHFTLISTGGGAALALLTGKAMPGLENLEDK